MGDVYSADGGTYGTVAVKRALEMSDERYDPSTGGESRDEAGDSEAVYVVHRPRQTNVLHPLPSTGSDSGSAPGPGPELSTALRAELHGLEDRVEVLDLELPTTLRTLVFRGLADPDDPFRLRFLLADLLFSRETVQ